MCACCARTLVLLPPFLRQSRPVPLVQMEYTVSLPYLQALQPGGLRCAHPRYLLANSNWPGSASPTCHSRPDSHGIPTVSTPPSLFPSTLLLLPPATLSTCGGTAPGSATGWMCTADWTAADTTARRWGVGGGGRGDITQNPKLEHAFTIYDQRWSDNSVVLARTWLRRRGRQRWC